MKIKLILKYVQICFKILYFSYDFNDNIDNHHKNSHLTLKISSYFIFLLIYLYF